jgi:sucrose phosphorylase
MAARAIQFFAPGVPQVYYVGLLAGENDPESVRLTGEGRAINRHNYDIAEIDQALQKDVVRRLLRLIRFRNEYPAFDGHFDVLKSDDRDVLLSWQKGDYVCSLHVNLHTCQTIITYTGEAREIREYRV